MTRRGQVKISKNEEDLSLSGERYKGFEKEKRGDLKRKKGKFVRE